MGPSSHFYSHMDSVWSLLIVGTGFVPWVELPIQRRLCPFFREWCRVTRHPRVFHRLTGCQRTSENWGVTSFLVIVGGLLPTHWMVCVMFKGDKHDALP